MSCSPASPWLSPGSAPVRSQKAARRSGVRQYATTLLDGGDGGADARDLALGLPPAADDAERAGVRLRQVARGDAARRPGAELAEPVGLDHRDRLAGCKQADDEARAFARREVGLRSGQLELGVGRRHYRERAVRHAQPTARHVLDRPACQPVEALLDRVDRVRGRDQPGDVLLRQVERHAGRLRGLLGDEADLPDGLDNGPRDILDRSDLLESHRFGELFDRDPLAAAGSRR